MIPDNSTLVGLETFLGTEDDNNQSIAEVDVEQEPGKTYKMQQDDMSILTIASSIDNTEAIKQAVYKILRTERYEHEIYSWNYGLELKDLYGENIYYAAEELESRIEEALIVDDRIQGISDFSYEILDKNTISVAFNVVTINDESFTVDEEVKI